MLEWPMAAPVARRAARPVGRALHAFKRVAVRVRVCACMQKEVLKQLYPTPPFGERACNKECLVKSGKYIQPYSDCSLRRQDMTCT